ncbi:hypothetical protein [Plantactinospora mayteni]|uniref:hypothetical protein n=1 Tax=Plantactinospora mayteni TaxID=566021 RepID=UPI001942781F|nr:hypothetical protein [Plantactinospora mayteni]
MESLARSLGPLDVACRAVVLVPCRSEAAQLDTLLGWYADQRDLSGAPLRPEQLEVQLLVNRFADEPDDGAAAIADRYRGGRLRVTVAEYFHPPDEHAPLTMARKLSADVALWRALQRPSYPAPLYLLSEDADVAWIDPRYVALAVSTLDTRPGLDAARGQQDRCPWVMARHPLLVLMRRSWNFAEAVLARRSLRPDRNPQHDFTWNRLTTSGWNCAFTAEVYALVGGYNRDRPFEEDMDIGEKISCLRAFERDGTLVPQVNTVGWLPTRAEGSPRRWLYWAATGVEPYEDTNQHENFFRRDHERVVKDCSLTELEQLARPYTVLDPDRVTAALQRDLDFLPGRCGGRDDGRAVYQRVLTLLGFAPGEAVVSDGTLRIRSLDAVGARLERFGRFAKLMAGPYPATLPAGRAAFTWRLGAVPVRADVS